VNDFDVRIFFRFICGKIDVRGGLTFENEQRLVRDQHPAAAKAIQQLHLIQVHACDHLDRSDLGFLAILNFQSRIRNAYHPIPFHFGDPAPMTTPPLPEQIELHRDRMWRRDEERRIESALDAERFIEDVGFANTLTDTRRSGPSLYIAVCGRRDVSLPRNVQKDEETRGQIKEALRRLMASPD